MSSTLEYKGYHGKIEFSAEDNLLIGHVIGIQDSLNFHGRTIDEITNSFHESIDGYLELCDFLGKRPDKEYKGTFNVRISPELHRLAAIQAESSGISLNQLIQEAIAEKLSQQSKQTVYSITIDQQSLLARTETSSVVVNTRERYKSPVPISQ